ncbi:MAG: YceI family protein [Cyclobacteriaceae bacterium]
MKKVSMIVAAVVATLLMSFSTPDEKLSVDTGASELKWTGHHLAKSYSHWGNINLKSGSVSTDGSKITGGEFVIDMNTISNKDLDKEKDNAKLVGHLKSDDFFGVQKYPEAKLVIKKTEKKSGNIFSTVADLTIRGITKEISFDTEVNSISKTAVNASAKFKVKRTDFEVMYGWSIENAMLDGEFDVEVKLVAKK